MRTTLLLRLVVAFAATTALAAQSTLTTTFVSDNGGSVGGAVHFDLTVLNPAGVVINRLDVNCANPASAPATIEFWTTATGGTYQGNQVNPPAGTWLLRATAGVTTAGLDAPTVAVLNKPVPLGPGTCGVTLVYRDCAGRYTGTATVPPTQTVFANGDLQLNLGTAQNVPFSSATNNPRVANVTLHYAVQTADVADFTANVRSGASPLNVTFTDRSRTPSGPVLAWAWDFNGDNVVDSTVQNPVTVYPTCGDFTVSLQVTTAAGAVSAQWSNMISVDPLRAGFTATPEVGAPPTSLVQFTDTSLLLPSTWAWDFNSDGLTDSTAQNPVFPFGPGCHQVTLDVTRNCRVARFIRRITVATHNLTLPFNANSFLNRTSVIFFDLQVLAPEALSVCGIDFNSLTPPGQPMTVDVWLADTTWVGKHVTPAQWRKVATATGTTPGGNVAARLMLDRPILLLPGRSYGVGVHHTNHASYYLNASAPIQNADLALTFGAAAYSPNGPFTNATLNNPRQWVGALHYLKRSQWPQGAITWFGNGCPGSLGVPTLGPTGTTRPRLGTTTGVQLGQLPLSAAFLMLGFSNSSSPFGPLPLDLALFGMPGCTARVSPDTSLFLAGTGGTATFNLALPVNPVLAGTLFFAQGLALDPTANAFGAVTSDAAAGLVGSF